MAYTSWSVVAFETPSAEKWNILGTNDASFNDGTGIGADAITSKQLAAISNGGLINGKIVVTVINNDLVVAIKQADGTSDATTTNPIKAVINGITYSITAALSHTLADGTNWFNAGSTAFATTLINYFVYLCYDSADAAVRLGFSRIPYAKTYADFNATSTNNLFGAFNNAPVSTDAVQVVGRFSATLSASTAYTWSISGTADVINRPIFETDMLDANPTLGGSGSMTISASTKRYFRYQIKMRTLFIQFYYDTITTATTATNVITISQIFGYDTAVYASNYNAEGGSGFFVDSSPGVAFVFYDGANARYGVGKYDNSNWGLGANRSVRGAHSMQI